MMFLDGENKKVKTVCNIFSSVYKQMCASPERENDSFINLIYQHNTGLVILCHFIHVL